MENYLNVWLCIVIICIPHGFTVDMTTRAVDNGIIIIIIRKSHHTNATKEPFHGMAFAIDCGYVCIVVRATRSSYITSEFADKKIATRRRLFRRRQSMGTNTPTEEDPRRDVLYAVACCCRREVWF